MSITSIEWTDRTWNPTRGCSRISEGCRNCYAERQAARFARPSDGYDIENGPFYGFVTNVNGRPSWTGRVEMIESKLLEPLSWRKPQRVFVNSMSDLFHEALPDEAIDRVFAVMALCPHITFQVLTKRAKRMREYFTDSIEPNRFSGAHLRIFLAMVEMFKVADPHGLNRATEYNDKHFPGGDGFMRSWPLPNVWLGVSVEDQRTADERIPELLRTPAAIRFASYEPALGPVDFNLVRHSLEGESFMTCSVLEGNDGFGLSAARAALDWIIVGGESGPGARPFDIHWARTTIEQCKAAGVACFVKQFGACITGLDLSGPPYSSPPPREGFLTHWTNRGNNTFGLCDRKGGEPSGWPEWARVRQFPEVRP